MGRKKKTASPTSSHHLLPPTRHPPDPLTPVHPTPALLTRPSLGPTLPQTEPTHHPPPAGFAVPAGTAAGTVTGDDNFPPLPTTNTSTCSSRPPLPLPGDGFPQLTADRRRSAPKVTASRSPAAPFAGSPGRVSTPRPPQPTAHTPALLSQPSSGPFSPDLAPGDLALSFGCEMPDAACPPCSIFAVCSVAPTTVDVAVPSVIAPGAPLTPLPVVPPAGDADAEKLRVRGSHRPAVG